MQPDPHDLNQLDNIDQLAVMRANIDQFEAMLPTLMKPVRGIYTTARTTGFTRKQSFTMALVYFRALTST